MEAQHQTGSRSSFADLLRHLRVSAGLTQEELAEQAGLSRNAISALERGERSRPQRATIDMLASALGLEGDALADFAATARALVQTDLDGAQVVTEPPTNLLLPPTPLIGREAEAAQACRLLQEADARLLTLTGPGGVGKTRLAQEVAALLRYDFADGVFLVNLAPLADPAFIAAAIGQVLDLRDEGRWTAVEVLTSHLRDRQILLVLDNFEHLIAGAPFLSDLVASCPGLKLLVTSRAPMRVLVEQVLPVPPLALPGPDDMASVEHLLEVPAVALYVQRARAVDPGFALTAENSLAVAEICRRLDGLPLAIDLAAARTPLLPPQALLARLTTAPALSLLTDGARDLPERQQTLRRTLEWSYGLLDADEQRVFRRCAIFAGGATIEGAEAVVGNPGIEETAGDAAHDSGNGSRRAGIDGLAIIASLVEKSLLRREVVTAGQPRIGMLETVREYASELLSTSGEQAGTARAHAAYFLDLVETADPEMTGSEQTVWLERLDFETENLRAVLARSLAAGDAETGLRVAGALFRFWHIRGNLTEARSWLDSFLALPGPVAPEVRARALHAAGLLAFTVGEMKRAEELLEESLVLRRELDDKRNIANLLSNLGIIAQDLGELDRAEELLEECLTFDRALGNRWGIAASLTNFSRLARLRGDLERARTLQTESLALLRELGDVRSLAISLSNLGSIARDEGNGKTAERLFEESLSHWRQLDDPRGIGVELRNLGLVAADNDDLARAASLMVESIKRLHEIDAVPDVLSSVEALASIAVAQGRAQLAVRLLAAAETLRESIDAPRPPDEQAARDVALDVARSALTGEAFEAAWRMGAGLSLTEAVVLASEQG